MTKVGLDNKVGFKNTGKLGAVFSILGKLGAVFSIHGYGHWPMEK